jgi:hypothetical protein
MRINDQLWAVPVRQFASGRPSLMVDTLPWSRAGAMPVWLADWHPRPTGICRVDAERWRRWFGQSDRVYKWKRRGHQAADLIAGSVAKYASSGV